MLVKGILSFPTLFTPKVAKGATEAKYNVTVLLPQNDPQVPGIQNAVENAKRDAYPSGFQGADVCFDRYENKVPPNKDYHDPRFIGWWALACNAKADDKPVVVDMDHNMVIDPGTVYSGMVGYVNLNIVGYTKGRGGVGGFLNGVMLSSEDPPMGRLDNKPSVEQMFADVPNVGQQQPNLPPPPGGPSAPPPPPQQPTLVMTPQANGVSYEQYKASGWSDEQMIQGGVAIRSSVSFT